MNSTTQRRAWLVVGVLFLAQIINFFDKSVLGLAAVDVMEDLDLSLEQYGILASSFFWLFSASGVLIGLFGVSRIRPRLLLSLLMLFWACVQFPVVLIPSFGVLLVCRVLLGVSEGAATPTAINACHEWFPPAARAVPTAIVMLGTTIGSLVAASVLSLVIANFGWKIAFLVCGIAGAVVILLWLIVGRDGPYSAVPGREPASLEVGCAADLRVSDWVLWTDRTIIGATLAGFSAYWIVGFVVAWMAPFLRLQLKFDTVTSGWILTSIYVGHAVITAAGALLSRQLTKWGASERVAFGYVIAGCLFGSALSLGATILVSNPIATIVLLSIGTGLPFAVFPLSATLVGEVAPTEHRNRAVAVSTALLGLASILSPSITGWLMARDMSLAVFANALPPLVGGCLAILLLKPEASIARFAKARRGSQPQPGAMDALAPS